MTDIASGAPRVVGSLVGGRTVEGDAWFPVVDPYREQVVAQVARTGPQTVAEAIAGARQAQPVVAALSVAERAAILRRAADLVEVRAEEYAVTVSRQIGKALRSTRREVRRSAWTLRAAATAAETLEGSVPVVSALPEGQGLLAITRRVPVGVVGAVTPFNAPFNLVVHKVAPAFAAGDAVIVKPASQAPLSAFDVAALLTDAGCPPGAISVLPGDRQTVAAMTESPDIDLFTFPGGTAAGSAISRAAGARRVLLELGGNSPNLVHEDADLEVAVRECVAGGFSNTGQSCNSVQRIYVHERIAHEFTARVVKAAEALRVGDPLDPGTDVGTLVDRAAAERVEAWIDEARARGARILTGGERAGAASGPTVVAEAPEDIPLVCQEVFGPVVAILRYRDLADAIARANASEFGLQAAVFTSSLAVALAAADGLQAGGVLVNRSTNFRLDHLPYGGVKASGVGREGPAYAVEEMSTLKLVLIDPLQA